MPFAPFVIVSSTTEVIRGVPRVRVNEAYTNALTSAGLIPVVLPPMDASLAAAALNDVAGLVLTGGEDMDPRLFGQEPHPTTGEAHPERDAYELALARTARTLRIPTLAICRGVQVMNVALGGTLIQDIPSQHPSAIDHDPAGNCQRGDECDQGAPRRRDVASRHLRDLRGVHLRSFRLGRSLRPTIGECA